MKIKQGENAKIFYEGFFPSDRRQLYLLLLFSSDELYFFILIVSITSFVSQRPPHNAKMNRTMTQQAPTIS
jgi:hypothetical protein